MLIFKTCEIVNSVSGRGRYRHVLVDNGCRTVIITKLYPACIVRKMMTTLLMISVLTVLRDMDLSAQLTTEVIMIYVLSAVRTNCSKSGSWPTLFHRTRYNKPFAAFDLCFDFMCFYVLLLRRNKRWMYSSCGLLVCFYHVT